MTRLTLKDLATDPGGVLGWNALLQRTSEIFFIQLIRTYFAGMHGPGGNTLHLTRYPGLASVLAMVKRQPDRKWTLADLACRANMSRSGFVAAFTEMVGMAPMQYIIKVRLSMALSMLKSSQKSIATIAYDLGYDSPVAFSRVFKRHYGVSPAAYRKRNEKQEEVTNSGRVNRCV